MKIFDSATKSKVKEKRQKLLLAAFLLLLAAVGVCTSCASGGSDPLAYRSRPFSALVTVKAANAEFSANYSFSATEADGARQLSIELLSPESLRGLVLSSEDGKLQIFFEGAPLASVPASELVLPMLVARMLDPTAPPSSVLRLRGGECGLPLYQHLTAVTVGDTVIYVDPETGLPLKLRDLRGGVLVTVNSICLAPESQIE